MANGFLVVDEKDWADATPEQRSWMTFKTLKSIHEHQKEMQAEIAALKTRPWADRACSFVGGVFGGFLTSLGFKIGG
jgi:hypothetical protein